METEKLVELLVKSDLPKMQKSVYSGFIQRAADSETKRQDDKLLIKQLARIDNVSEILLSNEQLIIYTVTSKNEWDRKYPYRFIYVDNRGVWRNSSIVSPNLDILLLVYLQEKHNSNSFQYFAAKMLGIEIAE